MRPKPVCLKTVTGGKAGVYVEPVDLNALSTLAMPIPKAALASRMPISLASMILTGLAVPERHSRQVISWLLKNWRPQSYRGNFVCGCLFPVSGYVGIVAMGAIDVCAYCHCSQYHFLSSLPSPILHTLHISVKNTILSMITVLYFRT
jgi:hypothetical protein